MEKPPPGESRDWDKFRALSGLKKSDEMLEEYYQKLIIMCNEVITRTESTMSRVQNDSVMEGEVAYSEQAAKELISAAKIIVDRDGETLTYEKAKKLFKRLDLMKRLRDVLLKYPDFEAKVNSVSHPPSGGIAPSWYKPDIHDIYFLRAVSKWGILRGDLILKDRDLPFHSLHMDQMKALGQDTDPAFNPDEWAPGKYEDKLWMKEYSVLRRIEYYVDLLAKRVGKRGPKRGRKRAVQWTPADSSSEDESGSVKSGTKAANGSGTAPSASSTRLKLKITVPKSMLEEDARKEEKKKRRLERMAVAEASSGMPLESQDNSSVREEDDELEGSDSQDTDSMLEEAERRLASRHRKSFDSSKAESLLGSEGEISEVERPSRSLIEDLSTDASLASGDGPALPSISDVLMSDASNNHLFTVPVPPHQQSLMMAPLANVSTPASQPAGSAPDTSSSTSTLNNNNTVSHGGKVEIQAPVASPLNEDSLKKRSLELDESGASKRLKTETGQEPTTTKEECT